jgi:STE24 endopeptidase
MPVWILPLFNKFTPLPEGELRQSILELCGKAAYTTSGVFTMDGSKRSSHANAYFTGFGTTKRVVLFDTLLEQLSPPQTVAVLAHEIGHEKHGHITKSLALSVVASALGLLVLDWLLHEPGFFAAFGVSRPSYHTALTVFLFTSGPFSYFLTPLFAAISRHFEYQADRFACSMTGASAHLVDGLLELSKKSLSNLVPHPWYSFFHYTHPTLAERIRAMERLRSAAQNIS